MLIHEAFQGGWIWKLVAIRLRAQGHLVIVPTLDGCGERAMHIRPGIEHQRRAVKKLRAKWFELDTGHFPQLSMPAELTRVILTA